jgi:hypothetical protein
VRFAAVFALLAAVACGNDDDPPVPDPDAGAYAAAMVPFLPGADPDNRPNVFVAPFDEPMSLERQVAIIEKLGDGYNVTFVDDPATAVDVDAEGRPVRDEGLLVVLGRIPTEPPYVVRVEEYRREDDVAASLVTLVWRTDHWDVATDEPVEPEAVIVAE